MSSSESRKGSKLSTPEIGDKPHQPSNFHFPQREFGKTSVVKRLFQHNSFQRWPWLHYDEEQGSCVLFFSHVLLPTRIITCILSLVWRRRLFPLASRTGRMDAIAKFSKHEGSQCHKDSVMKTVTLPTTLSDVG